MNCFRFFIIVACFFMSPVSKARTVISLDPDWKFYQGEADGAETVGFDASGWETVCMPHDWSIKGPFRLDAPTGGPGGWLPSGVCWYRKTLDLPAYAEGKQIWVEFDGVMANSDVWFNGQHLGHRPSGYTSFRYDITDKMEPGGNNILVVKADTSAQPASRWYTGAGIYRHARLVIAGPVYIAPWGVYVTTPKIDKKQASVEVNTTLCNMGGSSINLTLRTGIEDEKREIVAFEEAAVPLPQGGSPVVKQTIIVSKPQLWGLDNPHLYTLVSSVLVNSNVVDEVRTPFGIRSAEFESKTGFWLNGESIKLKGVCLHHDGGAVGAAVPLGVWERRFKLLRELGVNAIRTAHNPPAPEFLDLCDRMGFLVMDEFFDVWRKGKVGADNKKLLDYHLYFDEWAHTDLREGVMRDRNHPSVILYSVGNEIHDTPDEKQAKNILGGLVEICHEADPSRPVTQALFRPNVSHDYDNGLADMLDVIGTNYRDDELLAAWEDKKRRKIIGTEERHDRDDWLYCRDNPQLSGHFLWPGIDYLGESSSWPLTVFNNGLLDRCGFVMPRGRQRQSWWSDQPMVAAFRRIAPTAETPIDPGYEAVRWERRQVLFPDWNPQDAERENVEVYSNAKEVELFLNGKSLGKKRTPDDCSPLNWDVRYKEGVLDAVAYNDRKEVARDTLRTAGEPEKIRLVPDRDTVGLTWDDVVHVEVQIVDKDGVIVPSAFARITFSVEGPGELVVVDSGNVVSTEPFQALERDAYQGRCLAILRAIGEGQITLNASADGLAASMVNIAAGQE